MAGRQGEAKAGAHEAAEVEQQKPAQIDRGAYSLVLIIRAREEPGRREFSSVDVHDDVRGGDRGDGGEMADVCQRPDTHHVTNRQAFALSSRDARGVHDEAAFMMSVFARAHRRLDKA